MPDIISNYRDIDKLGLSDDRIKKLSEAIDKRFGTGYFGLHAGISAFNYTGMPGYDFGLHFNNFNSVSGWATLGAVRWDEKKQKYVINFKGPGLGRTGRYS